MTSWSSDLTVGAFYFRFADAEIVDQIELAHGLILDIAQDGALVGAEVLDHAGGAKLLEVGADHGLTEFDLGLIAGVLASQVAGDRDALGITDEPPIEVESAPAYQLELTG